MHGKLKDKVALITGAGSGIGKATAQLFASESATVIVSDASLHAAQKVAQVISQDGSSAEAVQLDVTSEETWNSVMNEIVDRHGKLDVLVNNAGISKSKHISEMAFDEWRSVMAVNLDGVFLGTKSALHVMANSGGGSIVNVASVSGITPSAGASNYSASKSAVRLFSKTAAIECADARTGVRVNIVTPGGVKTPMWEKEPFFQSLTEQHGGTEAAFAAISNGTPSQEFFTPEEVARTIMYLASDDSSHLTGVEIVLDRRPPSKLRLREDFSN
ncbi:Cyclopentanol dehydrogenase [Bythopirellula goksoeyrii]|uniref:Cyclopentanol dehydrogenase n=2 Tax=Bythopirellula goksoeyrii TaxID=1400387 RepID=A0A5B9QG29_9BACT|nr:Cyclopentanol dehydrogenase [Bythopirellula goksoeyrii]